MSLQRKDAYYILTTKFVGRDSRISSAQELRQKPGGAAQC